MKTAPSRSPSRRSPSSRMSPRSPGFRRGRSPERRRRMSPPRSRERREFKTSPRSQQPPDFPIPRRSRSPLRDSKRRSFSPKRKSPKRERERREPERTSRPISRKRSRSKTPPVVVGPQIRESVPRLGPYSGASEVPIQSRVYQGPDSYNAGEPGIEVEHSGRSISSISERFPIANRGSYEDDRSEHPVFRGPEPSFSEHSKITGSVRNDGPVFRGPDVTGFDISELKNITVNVHKPVTQPRSIERTVINPEEVIIVRRPDTSLDGDYTSERSRRVPRDCYNEHRSPLPKSRRHHSPWEQDEANSINHHRNKNEGSRPIFAREEIIRANERSKYETGPSHEHRTVSTEEHQRVVAIVNDTPRTTGGPRYESPGRYRSSHPSGSYFGDRERRSSSREYVRTRDYDRGHRSSFEPREKSRDDRFERRADLRHNLELRRRDDSRYSAENVRSYDEGREYRGETERGSDLRMRIHEKRTDRHDERDLGHPGMDRMDRDRDRRMMQPSSPGERRRGPMEGGYGHVSDGERKMRNDMRMHSNPRGGPGGRRNDMSERFHHEGEFGHRPERFHGSKPWDANPEYVPKGRAYFEHDNRDEMRMPNRGRGMRGSRGYMRGRGMMRGRPRGSNSRGYYMGGRGTGRGTGRGYSPRFKQSSPHWEHDLFDNAPPDHGNNGFSK